MTTTSSTLRLNLGTCDLTVFRPDPTTSPGGVALILPGGSYRGHAFDYEGEEPAEWMRQRGAVAAVLRYRVAPHRFPAPLDDARSALRYLREHGRALGARTDAVAAWGFSAGGHLAGLLATDSGDRPELLIASYPVVTITPPDGHDPSRLNLLGEGQDADQDLDVDHRVDARTPPTFLVYTSADQAVPAAHSVRLYLALRESGVPAELHVFERGQHGVGLGTSEPSVAAWPALLERWLTGHGFFALTTAQGRATTHCHPDRRSSVRPAPRGRQRLIHPPVTSAYRGGGGGGGGRRRRRMRTTMRTTTAITKQHPPVGHPL